MRICDACGGPVKGGLQIGAALVCRQCEPNLSQEIKRLRAEGSLVNTIHIAKRLFREVNGTPGVLQIRDVPVELRERMDRAAFDEGISIRELVLRAMYQYLST